MQIYQALSNNAPIPQVIAFVGGGGKTTCIFKLAQELKTAGKRVLIATTTKIFKPSKGQFDHLWIGKPPQKARPGSIHVWSPAYIKAHNKLDSISQQLDPQLLALFDHILIEADGAKHKPIKAPREDEPLLPTPCHLIVAITGWEALSTPITPELVHRWDEFTHLTQAKKNDLLTDKQLTRLLDSPHGLFGPTKTPCVWIINKLDTPAACNLAAQRALNILPHCPRLSGIVLAAFTLKDPVLAQINRGSECEDLSRSGTPGRGQ